MYYVSIADAISRMMSALLTPPRQNWQADTAVGLAKPKRGKENQGTKEPE